MRDGVKLHTLIFLPADRKSTGETYTTIIDRSPYGYGDMEWITVSRCIYAILNFF